MGGKVRRLRVDVVEGEAELVLVHDVRGDFLADDLTKDGVAALGGIQRGIQGGMQRGIYSGIHGFAALRRGLAGADMSEVAAWQQCGTSAVIAGP